MTSRDYKIDTPPPTRTDEALRLVFSDLREEDRISRVQAHLDIPGDSKQSAGSQEQGILLGCFQQERLLGAVLARTQAGRTAVVWPPRLVAGQPPEIADSLLRAIGERLARCSVSMAHALLEPVSEADDKALRGGGFEPLAKLLYMFCDRDDFPSQVKPNQIKHGGTEARRKEKVWEGVGDRLDFEPYNAANHNRLAQVVENTYAQTLDCPRLNGMRRIEDVLDGYRDTGQFDPSRWLIVRHQGQDVGCLLMADHPEHGSSELVYMGIIPSARGHGWGREIAQYAKWLTAVQNRPRLVLAVDAENRPAMDMYTSLGFRVWEKRIVYAKFFSLT